MNDLSVIIDTMKIFDKDNTSTRKEKALSFASENDLDCFDIHVLRAIAFWQIIGDLEPDKKTEKIKSKNNLISDDHHGINLSDLKRGDWIIFHESKFQYPICVKGYDSNWNYIVFYEPKIIEHGKSLPSKLKNAKKTLAEWQLLFGSYNKTFSISETYIKNCISGLGSWRYLGKTKEKFFTRFSACPFKEPNIIF